MRNGHERARLRTAAARAAGRLRERRPASQLHPRRRRDRADPVGGQPADPGPRRAPRRAAVSPPAPRPGTDRGRRRALRGDGRGARPARPGDARAPPQRARQDRRRHDDAGLRRPLADSAPGRLHRRASRRRRSHLGQQRRSSTSSATASTSPSATGRSTARRRRRSPVRRDRLAGVQPAPAAPAASAAQACPPTWPRTRCCAWSPTAATSCRTGASGCTR